jgi:hypothetical protein
MGMGRRRKEKDIGEDMIIVLPRHLPLREFGSIMKHGQCVS